MKKILNWKKKDVVNSLDEVTLWSAPFGRLLFENIPMQAGAKILDIGFGTGFPLIELSQRFGEKSKVYGVDIWKEAIQLVREKIRVLEINNIEIIEGSAIKIGIENEQIDLVTSNLGINNFEKKAKVYLEIKRILKKSGRLCITTNPDGTFKELFELFGDLFYEMEWIEESQKLDEYISHRSSLKSIVKEFKGSGFTLVKKVADSTNMRFVDAEALLNHSLIRIGFRESWDNMVDKNLRGIFYEDLISRITEIIQQKGEFKITIPMLYLEFRKT